MENYLPIINGIPNRIRKGRNVYEGYQRGWGIQFGGLKDKILADPLYQEAFALAKGRTIMAEENRMNIFLILKFFVGKLSFGHVIEYGSYLGGNAIFMAYIVDKLYPGMKVYALDSFEGMPETDKNVDAHNKHDFGDVDFDELQQYVQKIGLRNLVFVKGLFQDTSETVLRKAKKIRMAHIDCDIKSAVEYAYENVKSNMVDGGYIVLDDATYSSCIGATEVVEDRLIRKDRLNSEQIFPHFVFRIFGDGCGKEQHP